MSDKVITHSKLVPTTPDRIWEMLIDPSRHSELDGSGMVQASRGEARLISGVGDTFGMDMKVGPLPYIIKNTVVAYDEGRELAWRHFGRHVWRWQLEPVEGGTMVTESFEWDKAPMGFLYGLTGQLKGNDEAIQKTLDGLAERFASEA